MDNLQYLNSVLKPVTAFLHEALEQVGQVGELKLTAGPLIQAIEAVPDAGRVAVFLTNAKTGPAFVSGPSFNDAEISGLARLVAEAVTTGQALEPTEVELTATIPIGNRVKLFPLRVPGERPSAVLVTVRDPIDDDDNSVFDAFMDQISQLAGVVVEDRRLRQRIAEQQSVMEALLGAAPDAIIHIAENGEILDFMGSAPKIFGWTQSEIIGKPVTMLMPEPHAGRHAQYIAAFLETGERKLPDFGRRLQARHKSGSLFPVEIALSQVSGRDGIEFIGIIRDISHRIEREVELDAMRNALDAAAMQSALGELAATIAHELNQPLTAIANYMDALEARIDTEGEIDRQSILALATKTASQARLGGEIIRRTRRMAMQDEIQTELDDFHGAVAEALSLVRKAPLARGVSVSLTRLGKETPCRFDRVQIQQIVINLVTNALRAMQEVEHRSLTVVTEIDAEQVSLLVSDTGPGVDDAHKPKIFDRFFRRSKSGMGLGLAVVRRISVAHGGDVRVADAEGGGALFKVVFPLITV